MKCEDCEHYSRGHLWNRCEIMEAECFMPQTDCSLVNDDGSTNMENPYFKEEE